jgi:MHS family proline/betaine transporter-like MFS transporter
LPFLLAAPLGLVGMYLRSKMEDPAVFQEVASTNMPELETATGLKHLLSCYWVPQLTLSGMVVALNVINYTLLSYMPTYFATHLGLSADNALIVPIIGMLFMMLFLPLAGGLSDRIGRKPLWWISLIGIFTLAIPLFHLMSSGLVGAIFGFALLGLFYVPQLATISATFPAIFPTHVRFAGFAITYNVSTSLFGGTAPALNEWLIRVTDSNLVPAYFMMGACVVGGIALLFVVETAGHSLRGTKIPGTQESQQEIRTLDPDDETGAATSLSSSYR